MKKNKLHSKLLLSLGITCVLVGSAAVGISYSHQKINPSNTTLTASTTPATPATPASPEHGLGPTKVKTDIVINNATNISVATFTNESLVEFLNKDNRIANIFENLPSDTLISEVNIRKANTVKGTILADITLDKCFPNTPGNGFLESGTRNWPRILLTGFKTEPHLTVFKKDSFQIENNAYVLSNASIPNFNRNLFDWYEEDTPDNLKKINILKETLIVNYGTYLFKDLPIDINPITDVDLGTVTFDPINGTVEITELKLHKYYNALSEIQDNPKGKNFIPSHKIILKNLLRIQTTFNQGYHPEPTGIGDIIYQNNNDYIWDVSKTSFFGAIGSTSPSKFSPSKPILAPEQVVQLFTNLPDERSKRANIGWFEISNRSDDDAAGVLKFTLKVKNINDARGEYLSYYSQAYTYNFTISGFKKKSFIGWSQKISNEGGKYVLNLDPNDKLQYLLFSNALADKNYLESFVRETMNKYIYEYVNGISENTSINFGVTIDDATKSIVLDNVNLTTAAGTSLLLPDLTITRFLSEGLGIITPILNITSLTKTFPSYYASNLQKPLSYETREILSNFFENVPLSKYNISNVEAVANNVSGDLGISFEITPIGLTAPRWSYSNLFSGFLHSQPTSIKADDAGVGLLVTDGSIPLNDLYHQLVHSKADTIAFLNRNIDNFVANPIDKLVNGFANTRVVDILPVKDDNYAEISNGSLLLGQVTLSSVVKETQVVDKVPFGKIKVEGFSVNARTQVFQNEEYLSDLAKDKINTVEELKVALNDPTSGVVSRLVRIDNPVPGATISTKVIKSDETIGTISIEFTISDYYDSLSNVLKDLVVSFSYQLNTATKTTVVNKYIKIDTDITKKDTYAYLYTAEDLKKLIIDNKTIFNKPTDATVTILPEMVADNQTGEIEATVKLSKYYDANGNLVDKPNTYPVIFFGAVAAGETSLNPKISEVDLSSERLVTDLSSGSLSQTELLNYVDIVNPSKDPAHPTTVKVDPSSVKIVDDSVGLVEAHFSIQNGFVMNGEKLVFEENPSHFWVFRFATKNPELTAIKPTIADEGISAAGTALGKATVNNIIDEKDNARTKEFIKEFIVLKQAEIFDNYPGGSFTIDMLGDMTIKLAPNVANILVTFELAGSQLPDGIGSRSFTLEIYDLKSIVDETRLHSKIAIGLSNIKGFSSTTYLNDFITTPGLEKLITDAIAAEPSIYMLHPVTPEEAAGKPYAKAVAITSPAPNEVSEVTISLQYLAREDNGSIKYKSGNFIIGSFNTEKTVLLKNRLSVLEDKNLVNMLPSEVKKEQVINFLQPQIELLFDKYPDNFLSTNDALTESQLFLGKADDVAKIIPIELTMHNCFTGTSDTNHGVGDKVFKLTLEGFSSTAQVQTVAREGLEINVLGNNLVMLKPYINSYVDEIFINPTATKKAIAAFTQALNEHPEAFFENIPDTTTNPFVKPNTLSIEKKVNLNSLTDIQISGEFYTNAQFVGGDPIYRNIRFVITGFETKSTIFRISSIAYPVETFFDVTKSIYYYDVMSSEANLRSFENAIKLKMNADSSEYFWYLPKCFTNSAIRSIELVPVDRNEQIIVNVVYSGVIQYSNSIPQGTFSDNLKASFTLKFTSLRSLDVLIRNGIQSAVDEVIVSKNAPMVPADITPEFIDKVRSNIKKNIETSNQYPNFLSEDDGWTVDVPPETFSFSEGQLYVNSNKIIIGVKGKKYNYFSPGGLTISNENMNYKPTVKQLENKEIIYIVFGIVTAVLLITGIYLGLEEYRSKRTSNSW